MVEIQPYEFKKRTNIEEHNDIVDKMNEVIGVINDTQMDTVDSRLTAVEGDVTALESEVSTINNELDTKADKTEIPDTSTFATKTEVDAVDNKVTAIDSQLESMQTEIDGKLSSVPIGGTNIGGVKNGGNVTINADGTMNASGTGTGIDTNVLTYVGNKLKSTVNGVDSNEVTIEAGGGGVSSVAVTNPAPGNITVNVDGKSGNADIDTLASGVEVYGSEFPPDSGNASAYIKLNDTINTGEIGKYTEGGTSFIRIGNEDTRLLADTVELRNEVPDEGCKLTSGANGELLVNGVAMKNYTLPVGGTALGGVKNGGNVTIDAQGNMNAPTTPAYTLPVASANTLGGVKIGSGINVGADGTISVNTSGGTEWIKVDNLADLLVTTGSNNIVKVGNYLKLTVNLGLTLVAGDMSFSNATTNVVIEFKINNNAENHIPVTFNHLNTIDGASLCVGGIRSTSTKPISQLYGASNLGIITKELTSANIADYIAEAWYKEGTI